MRWCSAPRPFAFPLSDLSGGAIFVFKPLSLRPALCNPAAMSQSAVPSTPPAAPAAYAHWTIYLPTGAIALVWAGIYGWAVTREPQLQGLMSLALAVEALGVPLLLGSAALRARVLAVEIRDNGATLFLRSGFFRPREISVGRREVKSVRLRRSLPQRLFGGGAIDVKTLSGDQFFVTDLDCPQRIVAALSPRPRDAYGHEDKLK